MSTHDDFVLITISGIRQFWKLVETPQNYVGLAHLQHQALPSKIDIIAASMSALNEPLLDLPILPGCKSRKCTILLLIGLSAEDDVMSEEDRLQACGCLSSSNPALRLNLTVAVVGLLL